MAHKVTFALNKKINLGGPQDIKIRVSSKGKYFGQLSIGKGGVKWRPKVGKLSDIRWKEFNERMK